MKNASNWIISNDVAVVIEDKYPKAKYHFLVLPRENIRDIFQVCMFIRQLYWFLLTKENHITTAEKMSLNTFKWDVFDGT